MGRGDQVGLAVDHVEADVHLRHRPEGLHQGVADDVRERHLPAAGAGEVVVDDDAVVPQQLDRDRAHAGRRRDGQARVHVGHGAGRGALEDVVGRLVVGGRLLLLLGLVGRGSAGAGCLALGVGRRGLVLVLGLGALAVVLRLLLSVFSARPSSPPACSRRLARRTAGGTALGSAVDSFTEPLLEPGEPLEESVEEEDEADARWSLPKKSHHTLSTLSGSFW